MKKVLAVTLLLVSVAGSAFAATTNLSSGDVAGPGLSIYGGVDNTSAGAAPSPLIKFSVGVYGNVNWVAAAHDHYAIGTKHQSGSKVFGTADNTTAIYWRQVATGAPSASSGMLNSTSVDSTTIFTGGGWTAY